MAKPLPLLIRHEIATMIKATEICHFHWKAMDLFFENVAFLKYMIHS